jgi:hypothetical protein
MRHQYKNVFFNEIKVLRFAARESRRMVWVVLNRDADTPQD